MTLPSSSISEGDRWAILAYVRELQRLEAGNAATAPADDIAGQGTLGTSDNQNVVNQQ